MVAGPPWGFFVVACHNNSLIFRDSGIEIDDVDTIIYNIYEVLIMKENEEIVQNDKTVNNNEWDFFDLAVVILHLVIFLACVIYYFVNAKPGIPVDMVIKLFGVLYFFIWLAVFLIVFICKCVIRLILKLKGTTSDVVAVIDQEECETSSDMDSVNDNKED